MGWNSEAGEAAGVVPLTKSGKRGFSDHVFNSPFLFLSFLPPDLYFMFAHSINLWATVMRRSTDSDLNLSWTVLITDEGKNPPCMNHQLYLNQEQNN